jgi:arsenate reductase-like glutaredoxin family protein
MSIKLCNTDIEQSSKANYELNINKVFEILDIDDDSELYDYVNVIKKLKDHYQNLATLRNKINSIIVYMRCNNEDLFNKTYKYYKEVNDKLLALINEKYDTNEMTEKEHDNWLTNDDIEKIENDLFEKIPKKIMTIKDYITFRNYLLFKIYQILPSRNEIVNSKIMNKPTLKAIAKLPIDINYFFVDRKNKNIIYQMNQYKTQKKYGQKNINLGNTLYKLFLKYMRVLKKLKIYYSFVNEDRNQMSPNRLSKVYSKFGEIVNKKTSTRLNRHIHSSNNLDVKKLKDLSNKMAHDINTHIRIYTKNI